ncbi:MAG: helix-hairpin-helix domain-containing protein [Flavobacteriaceae bacterium]|nr:helix-hairpin-helix domain-containing protein [Flavobacteriaceae bacterium]
MKIIKPHFWYNKSQRNGVFFLLFIIIVVQVVYSFMDNSTTVKEFNQSNVADLQLKIDALKKVELEKRKPKIYPFNPNYITDYKGAQIGMSIDEIDRLLLFRKQNKFINSVKEFQQITRVSDSLLSKISPYFKFPDWVLKQQQKNTKAKSNSKVLTINRSTIDLNFATAQDLETINGVHEFLAQRIVTYRSKLQGFTYPPQLLEVWKLDKEIANKILSIFKIVDTPVIKKININDATFKEVLSNPYIDYDLCKRIFEFRDEVAELQSIEELKKIEGFPIDKYDRIVLYLDAN